MSGPLFVFLVSGRTKGANERGGLPGTGDTFARGAWFRVGELVRRFYEDRKKPGAAVGPSDVLRFIHFACFDSTVGIYEHDFATMANRVSDPGAKHVQKNWRPLDGNFKTSFGSLSQSEDPKNFVEWKEISDKAANPKIWGADHNPANVSIVNVYHSVRKAGKAAPGSVLELSIFGHSFVEGPVLNNTDAKPVDQTLGIRDPNDTDGRASTDFQPNMGESGDANAKALDEFRAAFASTGSFRVWGCNIQDVVETIPPGDVEDADKQRCVIMSTVLQVVDEAYVRSKKRDGSLHKLLRGKPLPPGNTMIAIDMGYQIANEIKAQTDKATGDEYTKFSHDRLFEIRYAESFLNHAYHRFFRGEKDASNKYATVITRSLSDIIKFVAAEAISSYVFTAAEALGTVAVVGGAPGTSAEVDDNVQQHISGARKDEAEFFSKFLKVALDDDDAPVKRHFSVFDAQAVKTIRDKQANGIP